MTNTSPAFMLLPLIGSLTEVRPPSYASDGSELGSVRRRQRMTRDLRGFKFDVWATSVEKVTFDAFYTTDLSRGVQSFNWTHPDTSEVIDVLLSGYPDFTMLSADLYSASINIEEV